MKIGLIADTHINITRKNNSFLEHVQKSIDNFIRLCKQYAVEYIFVLGDFFHTKYSISTDSLIKANKIIYDLTSYCPVYCLIGNHDVIALDNNKLNLLDVYKYFKNIVVVDDYHSFEINNCVFHFLPYTSNVLQKINAIQCHTSKHNILFGHMSVSTFAMIVNKDDNTIIDYEAHVSPSDLQKFTHVFLGHFHAYQNNYNITYVSAPFQSSFNDQHSHHGFVIFDTETLTHQFFDNVDSPKFITLDFTKENIKKMLQERNCYIRFNLYKHISKDLLIAIKQKLIKNHYDVEFKFNITNTMFQVSSMKDFSKSITYQNIDDILTEYLQQLQLPDNITVEKMLHILHS